jgi:MoCo/4Fe-4S cofactor protein with predicted Tat translocation signal
MKKQDEGYWLGLEQLEKDPEFIKATENEFMSSPLMNESGTSGFDRRDFMKLMGASIALTSTGCLRRPVEKIIPYNKRPPEVTPGVANYYTSAYFDGTHGLSLLVRTREGRPLFLKGNPSAPKLGSGMSPRAGAAILSLHDPDRVRAPIHNLQNPERTNRERVSTHWEAADKAIAKALREGGVRILTGHNPSPSTSSLLADFGRAFSAKTYSWSLQNFESSRKAQRQVFGREIGVPRPLLDNADLIVSVDCDFLSTYLNPTDHAHLFGSRRDPDASSMSRLVAFESFTQLTGINADDRFTIKPSQQLEVVMGLMERIVSHHGASVPASLRDALSTYRGAAERLGVDAGKFNALADQLWNNRGRAVVLAGGLPTQTAQATQLQAAVLALNTVLGAWGKTLDMAGYQGLEGEDGQLEQLLKDLESGSVKVVILDGSINPMLAFPDKDRLRAALNKASLVISTSNYLDETSNLADYVLPAGHAFENWTDYEFVEGLYHIGQPTIRPMYDTRSFQDSLLAWMKAAGRSVPENFFAYLKDQWRDRLQRLGARNLEGTTFEARWNSLLKQGYYQVGASGASAPSLQAGAGHGLARSAGREGLELVLYANATVGDGAGSNNSWLQELPDPVTKIVWDNYLCVAPARAKDMKLKDGDVVRLSVGGISVEAPVHVLPGVHKDVVALAVGYGRKLSSLKVAKDVGVDAFPLVQWQNGQAIYSGRTVQSLEKTGSKYRLANTQGHHRMEGRQLVVETTAAAYQTDKNAGVHRHKFMEDIWTPREYTGVYQWGMTVDLSSCIGCSACVIACQSENNIPVVGKKYILQGREMHWIRLDRYWRGDADTPDAVVQPVLCQHCENAPCERVCPVLATVHSDEGLNDMVYNRCVGTRYCSNNCPYKVRRFNWFNYTAGYSKPGNTTHKTLNPDVTVRSRGVMEKCTFCVQRIEAARSQARLENRTIRDGDIEVACEAACPTNAIVFGDLNDKESRVSKIWRRERQYILLEEQNVQTRVRYLAKVRNADRDYGHHHHNQEGHEKGHETANTSGDHA